MAAQGPACAIVAGAATLYRNYFAPVGTQIGHTCDRQIDCLAGVGQSLEAVLGMPVGEIWSMCNGYAQCSRAGLKAIADWIETATPAQVDEIRSRLCVGLHWDVEVTDAEGPTRPMVSQAFCSALPVAYFSQVPSPFWRRFGIGLGSSVRGDAVGRGVFGNREDWIQQAIRRALKLASAYELDVRVVSYGTPSRQILSEEFG
jgi:hypothetical protein